jgi:uncharacterized YccA/Bax inhibitor family protein
MQSRNPVLTREFGNAQYATFREPPTSTGAPASYDAGADVGTGARMTIDDVVVKTAVLFVILLFGALAGWYLVGQAPVVVWISALAAFGVAMAVSFSRTTKPALVMLYAALEGVFLGGISAWYAAYGHAVRGDSSNIVLQAVTGTFVAFGVMLVLYKSGRLRVTPRFQRMMIGALVSYFLIAVVSLLFAVFGNVGHGWGFYGVGPIGLLLCAVGVGLACFTLVLDFDAIEKGVKAGLPERESWRGAFGLMVTLVWLYLELLRMLAILNGGNR